MHRASFGKRMSKGGQKMKYGKKKPMKSVKKKVKKKKKTMATLSSCVQTALTGRDVLTALDPSLPQAVGAP